MDENERRSFEERDHFVGSLRGAEMHRFFVQAVQALDRGLYLPGVVSLLNGIETSVRMTMKQLEGRSLLPVSDLGPVLGNPLLRRAGEAGLPVGSIGALAGRPRTPTGRRFPRRGGERPRPRRSRERAGGWGIAGTERRHG